MAWIELHEDLPDHPKTVHAADALKIDKDALVGKLARLWTWALDSRPDGFIADADIETVAEKMRWKKRAKPLMDALCTVPPGFSKGFLIRVDGGYQIHDWKAYTNKYYSTMEGREKDRTRKAKKRMVEKERREMSDRCPADNERTNEGRSADTERTKLGNPHSTVTLTPTVTLNEDPPPPPVMRARDDSPAWDPVDDPSELIPLELDPAFAEVVALFTANIHPPTPVEQDMIRDWCASVEQGVVLYAIREAAAGGARTAKYIDGIILRKQQEGVTTVAALEAHERDWADKKKQGKGGMASANNSRDDAGSTPRPAPRYGLILTQDGAREAGVD